MGTREAAAVTRRSTDMGGATRALADVSPLSFWLDSPKAPEPAMPFYGRDECDLAVVARA